MSRFVRTIYFVLIFVAAAGCGNESAEVHYLFVGTYTGEGSEGIYTYRFNTADGSVDSVGAATGVENPSYLTVNKEGTHLYAVNEVADSAGASVSAFSINRSSGALNFINRQSTRGGAPCYVSIDQNGQTVFSGNYLGGSFTAFSVDADGSLKPASATIKHSGSSVNKSRQSNPHVHCTILSPDNSHLYVTDLGTDQVKAYAYTRSDSLIASEATFVYNADTGAGPRHLTFHPNNHFAYLVNELNGTVVAFKNHSDSLQAIQTVSTLPEGYKGAISGADIHVSPDGKYLYASNREDLNDIVIYKIDQSAGTLSFVARQSSGGVHPRNFMIDPSGQFLLVANRNTDNIVIFKRDKETGEITKTGTKIEVSQPVCLKMIPVQ